jgi:hypothetical protein
VSSSASIWAAWQAKTNFLAASSDWNVPTSSLHENTLIVLPSVFMRRYLLNVTSPATFISPPQSIRPVFPVSS